MTCIIALSLTLSCKKDTSSSPGSGTTSTTQGSSGKAIMPLQVGNTWTYKRTKWHGVPSRTYTAVIDTITVSLSGYQNINNNKWFIIKNATDFIPQYFDLVRNKADGLWCGNSGTISDSGMMFKYPAQANDLYLYGHTYYHEQMSVDSIDEMVTVPKGSFKCVKYSQKLIAYPISLCLTPGIGLIRYTQEESPGFHKMALELVDYTLK